MPNTAHKTIHLPSLLERGWGCGCRGAGGEALYYYEKTLDNPYDGNGDNSHCGHICPRTVIRL